MLIVMFAVLVLSIRPADGFPNYKDDYMDEDLATFDYYKGTDEFDEGNRTQECEECVPELCPLPLGCRAGLVQDRCGCCSQCANLEGQTCDLGQRSVYYGLCGENLECKLDRSDGADAEEPETQCVCLSQKPLCGSDGQTYMNICKYKEAAYSNPGLNVSDGPCRTGMNNTNKLFPTICLFRLGFSLFTFFIEYMDMFLSNAWNKHISRVLKKIYLYIYIFSFF